MYVNLCDFCNRERLRYLWGRVKIQDKVEGLNIEHETEFLSAKWELMSKKSLVIWT